MCLICVISTNSHRAGQIQVGLEPAEIVHVTQSHPRQSHPCQFSVFFSFARVDRPHVPHCPWFCRLCFAVFPVFCSMPGVVPHILSIEYEDSWGDRLCEGWVGVRTTTDSGWEKKSLSKETSFSLLRERKSWKLRWEQFLLSRPGSL